jgi:DNA-binding beta-propeller fold protein YncE
MSRSTPSRLTARAVALVAGCVAGVLVGVSPAAASGDQQQPVGDVRNAVLVGNNWDGTADILAPRTLRRLGRVDVIPDRDERMAEIATDPARAALYLAIRQFVGEGNDQYVDDLYTTNNGKVLIASRPSFADVVAIRLSDGSIKWRFPVAGYRSDHMAMSPDGERVVVSASTGNVVHVLDVRTGEEVAQVESGDSPHENIYFRNGSKILHAAIGRVYVPTEVGPGDPTKGERRLHIIRTRDHKIVRQYDVRGALDRAGLEDVSEAVRPLTLSPNGRSFYFQLSFFHGFVEMSRRTGEITRVRRLPNLVKDTPREQYLLNSAHHGIAMNPRGTKLCVAGTMSDYATVVDVRTWDHGRLLRKADGKPYWVTQSADGRHCYISWSGTDQVAKISYRTGRIVDTVPVGDHPQRIRTAFVRRDWVAGLPDVDPADDVQSFPVPLP